VTAAGARVDPFGLTPDTGSYVPRESTERALAELVAAVQRAGEPVALLGPVGAGKTLLLHLLAERAGPGLRSVYLPNPRLEPAEICIWVARRLGAPPGEEATLLLRAWIAHLREKEQACLLLVDDADALPEATARWLGAFARESRGGLRLALAALAGEAAERALRALGGEVRRVELPAAMSPEETAEYVGWRLARAAAPEALRARFDAAALADLHRVAGGNVRRLHLAVEALLRGGRAEVLEDAIAEQAAQAAAQPAAPATRIAETPPRTRIAETPTATRDPGTPAARTGVAATAESGPLAEAEAARSRRSLRTAVLLVALALVVASVLLRRPDDPARPVPAAAPAAEPTPGVEAIPAAEPEPAGGPGASEPEAAPAAAPAPGGALAPTGGTLGVNLNAVPWARVEIDGIEVGETPLAGVPLRPGPHAFRAHLPDGRIVERTVEIDAANRHVVFE
jgi:type II secretory pathway predicted ATPase ExeA